jgi:hypothetical protein
MDEVGALASRSFLPFTDENDTEAIRLSVMRAPSMVSASAATRVAKHPKSHQEEQKRLFDTITDR